MVSIQQRFLENISQQKEMKWNLFAVPLVSGRRLTSSMSTSARMELESDSRFRQRNLTPNFRLMV
ncbi:hypothetical protein JZ751_020472 [Albula glossodonta]|uniref:Uncharacterized protein n=1 Tax=Albula glossodonta TaxID=121402 RepID=A0A8T2PIP6_9TELE|nr:hypothetical protein JZ751_020472 [Albula glossodonta]